MTGDRSSFYPKKDRRKSHVENSKIKSCTKLERLPLGGNVVNLRDIQKIKLKIELL